MVTSTKFRKKEVLVRFGFCRNQIFYNTIRNERGESLMERVNHFFFKAMLLIALGAVAVGPSVVWAVFLGHLLLNL